MIKCHYCKENIDGMPHECRYCGKVHCHKHIVPESHECKELEKDSEEKRKNWQRKAKDIFESKKIDVEYSSTKSIEAPYVSKRKRNKKKKTHKNHNRPNTKSKYTLSKTNSWTKEILMIIFGAIFLFFILSFLSNVDNKLDIDKDKIIIDNLSMQAFDYVNILRNDKNSENLKYEALSGVLKNKTENYLF